MTGNGVRGVEWRSENSALPPTRELAERLTALTVRARSHPARFAADVTRDGSGDCGVCVAVHWMGRGWVATVTAWAPGAAVAGELGDDVELGADVERVASSVSSVLLLGREVRGGLWTPEGN